MDRVLASHISDKLLLLSRMENQSDNAERIIEIAAEVELFSEDLQQCWGGPLNGQKGRQSLVEALINTAGLDAILETGSFRGVTTAWLAEKFEGPIYTCEVARLYYLQAKKNLDRFPNVIITMEDSRQFLEARLQEMAGEKRLLVYLDAHSSQGLLADTANPLGESLPLAEELKLLFSSRHKSIVIIDDFKVPGQSGYGFDDYGPGRSLSLELIEFLDEPAFRLYFPVLPADEETGARRGVCIVSNGLREVLDACPLIVGGSWSQWRIKELEHEYEQVSIAQVKVSDDSSRNKVDPQVGGIYERCEEIKRLICDWSEKFDSLAVSAAEYREYGKALVEERALNIDLKRRLHVLESDASVQANAKVELKKASDKLNLARAQLDELRGLIVSIQHSRALQAVSTLAPKARQSIMYAAQRIDGLINSLR